MKELLPKVYKKDVYSINYESLKEKGINYRKNKGFYGEIFVCEKVSQN